MLPMLGALALLLSASWNALGMPTTDDLILGDPHFTSLPNAIALNSTLDPSQGGSTTSTTTSTPPLVCPMGGPCPSCGPGSTIFFTKTGNSCPWCTCGPIQSTTHTPTTTVTTKPPSGCPTHLPCSTCPPGETAATTTKTAGQCPQCFCVPTATPTNTCLPPPTGKECPWCTCVPNPSTVPTPTPTPTITTTKCIYPPCPTCPPGQPCPPYVCEPICFPDPPPTPFPTPTTFTITQPPIPVSPPPGASCGTPTCTGTCPPYSQITTTRAGTVGTECPYCTCVAYPTNTTASPPIDPTTVIPPTNCPTFSCPGCGPNSYITQTRPAPTACPQCAHALPRLRAHSCGPNSYITQTRPAPTACPQCACVVYPTPTASTPTACPTFSCPGCGPNSYITQTRPAPTACPQCACIPYPTPPTTPSGTPLITTPVPNIPPVVIDPTDFPCPTLSCPGCGPNSYITQTKTVWTECPHCTCVAYATPTP
ncbi:hypothetical protein FA13DRAFT_1712459 [Coprinellus micaceus]|uniref:Uncharacterized protein n=1 Tax=Coprinellus micaceus TaxID=71717 RepID=A0A4Y7T094_COPMI|nr:hypothetical protein FA13DRAFT_1712459 [Coprinellus micaceus]